MIKNLSISTVDINNKKLDYELPFLWIRDNCPFKDCRVEETKEKRFMLNSIPANIKPKSVDVNDKAVNVFWPDNHETVIHFQDIEFLLLIIYNFI